MTNSKQLFLKKSNCFSAGAGNYRPKKMPMVKIRDIAGTPKPNVDSLPVSVRKYKKAKLLLSNVLSLILMINFAL